MIFKCILMLYLLFNFGLGNKVLKRAFPDIVIKIIINAFLRSNTLLLVQLISSKIIKKKAQFNIDFCPTPLLIHFKP